MGLDPNGTAWHLKTEGAPAASLAGSTGRGASPSWLLAAALFLAAGVGVTEWKAPARRPDPHVAALSTAASPLLPISGSQRPTYVLFQNATSSMERQFLETLRREGPARDREDLRVVLLDRLDSVTARRFRIQETPTLIALGERGREISRRVGPQAITAALAASGPGGSEPAARVDGATCRVWRGPRLRWVKEDDPRARRVYRRFGGGRWEVPDIFKAMSLRPDLMEKALDLSERGHFSDGYLDRRTKERIATFVSALNGSHYCIGSHAGGLRNLGARSAEVAALARGDLEGAGLSARDHALFQFVRRLTLTPGEIGDADVARLRGRGWRDEQIFEAAFDASLFAMFNRVAITYGLDYPPDGWKPTSRQLRAGLPSAN
jgi:uncharacterized peroxidase-related enzyme